MEAANLSETLVIVYQSERRYSLEDLSLHRYYREFFKSLTLLLLGEIFFPQYLGFPLSVSLHQCSIHMSFIYH